MDETYIKIKGKNAYLYRVLDSKGNIIDFFVSEHRDKATARKSLRKDLNANHTQKTTEIAII